MSNNARFFTPLRNIEQRETKPNISFGYRARAVLRIFLDTIR